VPSPDWKTNRDTNEERLMKELRGAIGRFEPAYKFMMSIIGDLEDHYYEGRKWKKEEK
jgi:hypothetical protein